VSRPALPTRRLAVVLLAAVLPLAACAGTDSAASGSTSSETSSAASSSASGASSSNPAPSTPEGQRIEVEVTGGQVTGDTGRVPVAAGEQVTLVVTADTADELHVHGYDLTAALAPGAPAEVTFDATLPGVFEVELHEAGTVLLTLQVQ
jgi:hypothetical protein